MQGFVFFIFTVFANLGLAEGPAEQIDTHIKNLAVNEALQTAEKALQEDPQNTELRWRYARTLVLKGNDITDEDKKVELYKKAEKVASELIKEHPDYIHGYLRRAVANGRLALFQGVLKARELIFQIRDDAKKAIELNNGSAYDLALAHYLLGRVHYNLAEKPRALRMPVGLSWATYSKAGEHLKKAAETYPKSIPFQYDYARYLQHKEKNQEAIAVLQKALKLEMLDPGDVEVQQKARALLKELQS